MVENRLKKAQESLEKVALDFINANLPTENTRNNTNDINGISIELRSLLANRFIRCFLSTVRTTCSFEEDDTAFVITGDIPAMWLRDSAAQVTQYLPFAAKSEPIKDLIRRLLKRQYKMIRIDPYANAFNRGPTGERLGEDLTDQGPHVWERKYEVDSLCAPIRLTARYVGETGDDSILGPDFRAACGRILDVFTLEQHHENSPYRFQRLHCPASDTLPCEGRGTPVGYTGMTWSGFRPSDDACTYGYPVAANLFAAAALMDMESLLEGLGDHEMARRARVLSGEIRGGVEAYGRYEDAQLGTLYAYEVDGLGHHVLMDDANVPSLLSLPYLGCCAIDDPIYQNTRAFVLSPRNPYYHEGLWARGVGSPHTPSGYIWHIALCMQGLTSLSVRENAELLAMALETTADTGYMHESFDPDDPRRYTRSWFAWANSLFADWILTLARRGMLTGTLQEVEEIRAHRVKEELA